MKRSYLSIIIGSVLASCIFASDASSETMQPLASETENSKAMMFYRTKRCSALLFGMSKIIGDSDPAASNDLLTGSWLFLQYARDTAMQSGFESSEDVIVKEIEAIAINYFKIWQENARMTGHNFENVTQSDAEYCNSLKQKWG